MGMGLPIVFLNRIGTLVRRLCFEVFGETPNKARETRALPIPEFKN